MKYELVVGLETHVELSTHSKIFCSCSTTFGAPANSQCCPVCLGLPGALPRLNREAVVFALRAGLALHCEVNRISRFDRKNYNYPDLPKGYQITQQRLPLCQNGYLELDDKTRIPILQIHMEEDAGKLIHKDHDSYVDFNRAGVPLIEIVSAPCFSSSSQAGEYVTKLRLLLKYLGISDCRMQEGSLRCDVNVSVRTHYQRMGKRVEIKNINSVGYMEKAIDYEFSRQTALLNAGGTILPETRRYLEESGATERMRGKEETQDYRYFPDPDLPELQISETELTLLRDQLPELPAQKFDRYLSQFNLPADVARLLVQYPNAAYYFEEAAAGLPHSEAAAHLILGPLFAQLSTEAEKETFQPSVCAHDLHDLLAMQQAGDFSVGFMRSLLSCMISEQRSLRDCLAQSGSPLISDEELTVLCQQAVNQNPTAKLDYISGKQKALQVMLGFVMKQSGGRANPQRATQLLKQFMLDFHEHS